MEMEYNKIVSVLSNRFVPKSNIRSGFKVKQMENPINIARVILINVLDLSLSFLGIFFTRCINVNNNVKSARDTVISQMICTYSCVANVDMIKQFRCDAK
eukprot:621259_1